MRSPSSLELALAPYPFITPQCRMPVKTNEEVGCFHTPPKRAKAAGELVPEETSAHTLRHIFARSYLAHNPGDLVGLSALLEHSSLVKTKLYCEPSIEQLNINAYSRWPVLYT